MNILKELKNEHENILKIIDLLIEKCKSIEVKGDPLLEETLDKKSKKKILDQLKEVEAKYKNQKYLLIVKN